MRILILGGTVFLGRHLLDAALAAGHDVTIFHRGHHPGHRTGEVDEVLGDRGTDLDRLAGRTFDAVIDPSAYLPAHAADSSARWPDAHYTLVSSGSVYADLSRPPITEDTLVQEPPGPEVTDVHGEWYGPQKAGCELAALAARRGEVLIQRAGLLVGPFDPTDRFTYWVQRMRRPGPVLAPDVPDQPVQYLDARDLAEWTIRAAEQRITGVMNAVGPAGALTFRGLLAAAAGDRRPEIAWTDEQRLLDAGVAPWTELPIWLPERFGMSGLMELDTSRAQSAGLTARPPADTIRDIAAWADGEPDRIVADYGTRAHSAVLTADRERELLRALS